MNDRAVSLTLGYILALAISTLLVTGLIIAGGNFVEDQREQVIEQELGVIGQHIASNVEQADRMVNASKNQNPERVVINQTFQNQVTGSTYNIELDKADSDSPAQVVLTSAQPEVTVRTNVTVGTTVGDSFTTGGGGVSVQYNGTALVIADA